MDDAERLLEWRNDPDVLAVSKTTAPVTWEQHQAWLARILTDSSERVWIGHDEHGVSVGTVRLQLYTRGIIDGQVFHRTTRGHVSVTVDPAHRGRGIGRDLLECVRWEAEALGLEVLTAEVRATNAVSLVLFIKAGYRPRAMCDPWVYLEKGIA